eukprot:CAMPEP_0118643830 /NCGR_PEP_ID=MMETSP0785-20121206/6601_1 /TAXON_ID=91992 /ORGANISM="Bolidomonas pacifica, Strain CCMP 1866" /LENGTH=304 /DNA_ID=CAMNT_0006535521 /DNA_START=272 /DNA_END=1183 /DNA_ORIENTATION=+
MKALSLLLAFTVSPSFGFTPLTFHVPNPSVSSTNPSTIPSTSQSSMQLSAYELVLLRHGESTWNEENRFTGWADVPLSEKGLKEARAGGMLMKEEGMKFDVCYTSMLRRAIHTLWLALEEMDQMYVPIKHTWRLNERHYGALQGLNKQETVDKHGKDQVLVWRRSYDIPPPELGRESEHWPGNDGKYDSVDRDLLPTTESLKLTEDRFLVDWHSTLVPEIKSGKKILIAAHGNTLRALVKHLDGISEDEITGLNIPTGVPLVYTLDEDLKPIKHPDAIAPLQGRYLGNQEDIRNRIGAVAAQTK